MCAYICKVVFYILGTEYKLSDGVTELQSEVENIFTIFLIAILLVLILSFFNLASRYKNERTETYADETKYKGCKKSTLKVGCRTRRFILRVIPRLYLDPPN